MDVQIESRGGIWSSLLRFLTSITRGKNHQIELKGPAQKDIMDIPEHHDHHNHQDHQDHQDNNDHHPLVNLPPELSLAIASYLDKESQVLLSLSCRRLRLVLTSNLDLAFGDDRATKTSFLHILELDHPEYLTCHSCTLLYLWRRRRSFQYECPRESHHAVVDVQLCHRHIFKAGDLKYVRMSPELVNLILRGAEHGPSQGPPISFLNMSGHDSDGISQTHEARLVDGQLILASQVKQIISQRCHDVAPIKRLFRANSCLHQDSTVYTDNRLKLQTLEKALACMRVGSEKSEVFKCPFCETDHQVHVKKTGQNQTTITINVWRNYGRRHRNKLLSHEQIFHPFPVLLCASAVSGRDVRADFECETGCTPSLET